jgi:hypothetical protein
MPFLAAPALLALALAGSSVTLATGSPSLDLSGDWQFAIDRRDAGEAERWFARDLSGRIELPGSMAERGLGDDITVNTPWTGGIVDQSFFTDDRYAPYREPGNVKVPFWLTPRKHYVGAAWYRREVKVPEKWAGQRVLLRLERPHWQTTLWWDDQHVGSQNSLSTPHVYDLTDVAKPGRHSLTVRVDNRMIVPVGINSHSVSDHTQGNWNGLVGDLELVTTPKVWIEDIQVFPDVANRSARLRVQLGNLTGDQTSGELRLQAEVVAPVGGYMALSKVESVRLTKSMATVDVEYPLGPDAPLWDEFSRTVFDLVAELRTAAGLSHKVRTTFGLRELGQEGTQFTINGRRTFLRGTLECCIFPLTGYPPTDAGYWSKVIQACQAHGLNHMRFHSWCPPKAAFEVADLRGFYLHVECASWANQGTSVDDPLVREFIVAEADRILREYGNHPSFCFLAYGNEPAGRTQNQWLGELVNSWKAKDPRRRYTSAAGWPIIPANEFHDVPAPRIQAWGQGLRSRINAKPPETVTDYSDFIAQHDVPVISHEIGQWCVYPNLKERAKYTGVMQALNFDIFADSLAANGMAHLADDFLHASGKLQALCYKEEIESALRTPGMGGFQLLDLHDFPGQGTALVGVLDPFWEEKGYITPEEYRRFCNATVPLALLPKRTFLGATELTAGVKVAHFGPEPLEEATVSWWLAETNGTRVAEGRFPKQTIPIGNDAILGEIKTVLPECPDARKLILTVAIDGTGFSNDWDIWQYPGATGPLQWPHVTGELDEETVGILENGGRVLLRITPARVAGDELGPVATGFSSIFWNTAWTRRQAPHTLGILCDPSHPAFAQFPTETHSNWQWWYPLHGAQAMILDDLPADLQPLVRMIDDWVTNRRLALAFEARVGQGRVLVCSFGFRPDFSHEKWPLLESFMRYMDSDAFDPKTALTVEQLQSLFKPASPMEKLGARVRRASSFQPNHEPELAIDGNPDTMWHTAWGDNMPGFPHQLEIGFEESVRVSGVRLVPRRDNNRNGWIKGYRIEVSEDGEEWTDVAEGELPASAAPHELRLPKPAMATALRLVALSGHTNGPWASLAELEVIPVAE